MINLAHMTHGDALTNTTLSRRLPGAFTRAFISEWMQPQLPGTDESHLFGRPRALPLYPIARTFSSRWSVTTVPTWSRTQVERLASSSDIRMYTSYNGMRSTGGTDAPVGSRFEGCVLAGTPSLDTLMQLLVGIVLRVLAPGALLRQPGVEPRRDEPVGALLALRGADRHVVGVLVLRVTGVAFNPRPMHVVRLGRLDELLPQLEVLDRAAFSSPAARLPVFYPLVHALDQVLGIGNVAHARVLPLAADPLEGGNGAGEGHPVVRRLRRGLIKIPPRHAVAGGGLDQRGVAPRAGLRRIVPETALVRVHQHEGGWRRRHGWTTTGMSVCRRICSACDNVTLLSRPCVMCAPAKRASHLVRATTRATTSPGVPDSMWVTNVTPCSESTASASPTTWRPAARSIVAWMMCTVLCAMLANRAASSSARRLVSRPS